MKRKASIGFTLIFTLLIASALTELPDWQLSSIPGTGDCYLEPNCTGADKGGGYSMKSCFQGSGRSWYSDDYDACYNR